MMAPKPGTVTTLRQARQLSNPDLRNYLRLRDPNASIGSFRQLSNREQRSFLRGIQPTPTAPAAPTAPAGGTPPAPTASTTPKISAPSATDPGATPFSALAARGKSQIAQNLAGDLLGLASQEAAAKQIFGIGDVSNPFSRMELLKRTYQQAQSANRNRLASRGQLFSGLATTTQSDVEFGRQQSEDTLRREFDQLMLELAQRRAQLQSEAERKALDLEWQAAAEALNLPYQSIPELDLSIPSGTAEENLKRAENANPNSPENVARREALNAGGAPKPGEARIFGTDGKVVTVSAGAMSAPKAAAPKPSTAAKVTSLREARKEATSAAQRRSLTRQIARVKARAKKR